MKDVKASLRSVVGSFSHAHFALPPTEVKLLLALVIGATLLFFALGAIAISSMEQRNPLLGEARDLKRSKIIRAQLNLNIQRLERRRDGGSRQVRLLPQLNTQTSAEHVALVESIRSRPNLGTNPALVLAQTHSDERGLASLRGRVTEMYDAEKFALNQRVNQQAGWYRKLMTVSAATAVAAAALLLFVYSLFWSKVAANQPSRSATPDLPLDTAKQSPASSPPAAHDVTSMVDAARVAERASIARDIHDELGALLMAIKIDLKCSSKNTTTSRRAVDSHWPAMLDRVDAAMNAVARIAGRLKPILVDQIGLWPAIESYVREFEEVTKIPCNLRIDVNHPPLQGEMAHEVFRIFQESLTNVARHAQASRVDVKIGVEDGQLEVKITDDGTGISPDQILDQHSLGVAGMFERTRRFGGELHIDGRPESGTKVTLRMPAPALQ